jgi:hypothetical protein
MNKIHILPFNKYRKVCLAVRLFKKLIYLYRPFKKDAGREARSLGTAGVFGYTLRMPGLRSDKVMRLFQRPDHKVCLAVFIMAQDTDPLAGAVHIMMG